MRCRAACGRSTPCAQIVLALDGVRDALVYDPYGGLDKATPPFGEFCFADRLFQSPRALCNPYFFTITVAPRPGSCGRAAATSSGCKRSDAGRDRADPADLDLPDPGVRRHCADRAARPAHAGGRVPIRQRRHRSAASQHLAAYIGSLRLGDAVLYAQVLRILAETPGVRNVQDLRLRRCPPRFGEIVCGPPATFGDDADIAALEAPCGGDMRSPRREVAVFAADSPAASRSTFA